MDQRSARAEQILNDPVVVEAFEKVKAYYISAWESADSTEKREECHRCVQTVGKIRQALKTAMADGKLEEFNSEQKRWFA